MLGSFWKKQTDGAEAKSAASETSSSTYSEPEEEDETNAEERKLQEETWVEWIQRCTHMVELHWREAALDVGWWPRGAANGGWDAELVGREVLQCLKGQGVYAGIAKW